MALDVTTVMKELQAAQEEYVETLSESLGAELERKTTLEQLKCSAATKGADGKGPSEASCERMARCDPTYLKAAKLEIEAVKRAASAKCAMELVQYKMQAAIAMLK